MVLATHWFSGKEVLARFLGLGVDNEQVVRTSESGLAWHVKLIPKKRRASYHAYRMGHSSSYNAAWALSS